MDVTQSGKEIVIGMDLGGTNLRVAGITKRGDVISPYREKTAAESGPEVVVERIIHALRRVRGELSDSGWKICGVALGAPGIISKSEGIVVSSPNLPGWDDIPLQRIASEKISLPVLLENDTNAAAFGEFWIGAGRNRNPLVMLTLGTGVGGGIIIGGRLLRGADGMAGEIGHMTVEPGGRSCPCGNRGCLEQYASATSVSRRYCELRDATRGHRKEVAPGSNWTAERVNLLAREGDSLARQAFTEAGSYLGMALASLVNIVNPEMIIIGGGVLPAWELIIPAAREEMYRRAFRAPAERTELSPATLGDRAGYIGAAGLFWHQEHVLATGCRS